MFGDEACKGCRPGQRAQFANQRADASAKLERTARPVAFPERHLARLARSGNNQHAVVRDVFDPPGRSAKDERLVGMRFEDHLLVQFAHTNGLAFGVRKKDAVETAVGDGAGVEDGETCCAVAGRDDVADAIPGKTRAKFGELVRGITATEQIENTIECCAGESAKGRGAADQIVESVDVNFGLRLFSRWIRALPGLKIQTWGTQFVGKNVNRQSGA